MKKIISRIAVLALIVGGFTSCDNELDQIPFDETATENAYLTASDFENAARGIYATMTGSNSLAGTSYWGGSDTGGMLDAPDVLSDNVTFSQIGRFSRRTLHNWQYGPADYPLSGLYNIAYSTIFAANQLLDNVGGFEGDNRDNVVAEAKALRALAHFNVVTFFGKIPTESGDANGSLGIAYMTEPDPNALPARETVGAVYAKIVEDLVAAAADINVTSEPGRLNRDAVNTLLSRVYLYMGEWQKAATTASLVSATVAPRESVVGVWEDTNRDGVLFYIPNESTNLNLNVGVVWSQGAVSAIKPEYVVSYELNELFQDQDIRKEAYTFVGTYQGEQYNAIKKLFGRPGQSNGMVDIKIFRAAEAPLNLAEAQFNLGNEGAARAALDQVRSKRYTTPPSGETGNALRDAIRLERRLEFAFEYQRFFDLKRWGQMIERDGRGDKADGTGTASDVQVLPANSYKFELPLSQGAMDRNPNNVQNPGY